MNPFSAPSAPVAPRIIKSKSRRWIKPSLYAAASGMVISGSGGLYISHLGDKVTPTPFTIAILSASGLGAVLLLGGLVTLLLSVLLGGISRHGARV